MPLRHHTDIDPAYGRPVELSPLVRRVVCHNPGRFTYTGTGTYLVGRGQVAIVDPGPDDEDHVGALLDAVAGEEVTHILITHTHRDHSPAAAALQTATGARCYGYGPHPVASEQDRAAATPTSWDELHPTEAELAELRASMPTSGAHDAQEEPGDMAFTPDVEIGHGDQIRGGTWTLDVLHTPGHLSNHLCFGLREEQALFTGDHVMGWSTSVIPQPDGSLADYLASLELLVDRDDRTYYPTHGPPVPDPVGYARSLLEHRGDRTRQIIDGLASGPKTIPQLVALMYTETPHILHMAAGQSVLSHLLHLVQRGEVSASGAPGADSIYSLA